MAKRGKPKKPITKTAKRKKQLLRQVSRMEARGYWFEHDVRSEIRNLSPQKARFYTTDTLYKKAFALDIETETTMIHGEERRAAERKAAAKKAAETRKKKKREEERQEREDFYSDMYGWVSDEEIDITDDLLNNFSELVDFLDSPPSDTMQTMKGKEVQKPPDLWNYDESVKRTLKNIFDSEKGRDPEGLANRLYDSYTEIDELMGVIEYSGYKESVRTAANELIKIMRGTDHLSREDEEVSEALANQSWDDAE